MVLHQLIGKAGDALSQTIAKCPDELWGRNTNASEKHLFGMYMKESQLKAIFLKWKNIRIKFHSDIDSR